MRRIWDCWGQKKWLSSRARGTKENEKGESELTPLKMGIKKGKGNPCTSEATLA